MASDNRHILETGVRISDQAEPKKACPDPKQPEFAPMFGVLDMKREWPIAGGILVELSVCSKNQIEFYTAQGWIVDAHEKKREAL